MFYFYPSLLGKMKSILYSQEFSFQVILKMAKMLLGDMKLVNLFFQVHHDQIFGSYVFKENPLFGIGAKNFKYTLIGWHPQIITRKFYQNWEYFLI